MVTSILRKANWFKMLKIPFLGMKTSWAQQLPIIIPELRITIKIKVIFGK
jgi:hypothetical protein